MSFDSSPTGSSWAAALRSSCIIPSTQENVQPLANHSINVTNLENQSKALSNISEILSSMKTDSNRAKLRELDDDKSRKDEVSN
jgi:hypothetical protein